MKFLLLLPSLAITLIVCAAAFVLTTALSLPSAADIGIWVIAGGYSLVAVTMGLVALAVANDI